MTISDFIASSVSSSIASDISGGAFAPNSFANCVLWLDAGDSRTVKESSGSVSKWNDKSGQGNDVTQGSAAKQPTTDATTQNGKNVIDWDGSDNLIMPSGVFGVPANGNTCFVVTKRSTETGGFYRILDMREASGSRYALDFGSTAGDVSFASKTAAGGGVTNSGNTNTDFQILRGRRDGSTQALAVDRGAESTNTNGATETGIDEANIGSLGDSSGFLLGSIAEIIIYERSLSTAEIAQVESYLSNKWGI